MGLAHPTWSQDPQVRAEIHGLGLPHPWIYHHGTGRNIYEYVGGPKRLFHFPMYALGPPHPRIFHHESDNKIDEYLERSMDGGTRRVALQHLFIGFSRRDRRDCAMAK